MLLVYSECADGRTEEPAGSKHTCNNSSNCKEHESILPEERQDIVFGDLLHFPLCLHGAYVDAFPDTLHPANQS